MSLATCLYCGLKGHASKGCLVFAEKKRACTTETRVLARSQVKVENVEGCCAAGMLVYRIVLTKHWPYYKVCIYAIKENRNGQSLYNFPGGKREGKESPEQMAERELMEETGLKLACPVKDGPVLWVGQSKYMLFPVLLTERVLRCRTYETELILVPDQDLRDHSKWHPFAATMLKSIFLFGLDKFLSIIPPEFKYTQK